MRRGMSLTAALVLAAAVASACAKNKPAATAAPGAAGIDGAGADYAQEAEAAPDGGDEDAGIDALVDELARAEDELEERGVKLDDDDAPLPAAEGAGSCERICKLTETICDLESKICELAERHDGEQRYADACARAEKHCERATKACTACA